MDATAEAPQSQHMKALARANEVRLKRAELKRDVSTGATSVADVIRDVPWEAETMTISDLLMSQHRWGRTRCRRFLASIPMSEQKTIGTMTDRQRRELRYSLTGEWDGDPPTIRRPAPVPVAPPRPAAANGNGQAVRRSNPAADYLQQPL